MEFCSSWNILLVYPKKLNDIKKIRVGWAGWGQRLTIRAERASVRDYIHHATGAFKKLASLFAERSLCPANANAKSPFQVHTNKCIILRVKVV